MDPDFTVYSLKVGVHLVDIEFVLRVIQFAHAVKLQSEEGLGTEVCSRLRCISFLCFWKIPLLPSWSMLFSTHIVIPESSPAASLFLALSRISARRQCFSMCTEGRKSGGSH